MKEYYSNSFSDSIRFFWRIKWIRFRRKVDDCLYGFEMWRVITRLSVSCRLWELRGLPSCPEHGFHAQSWITGKCRECRSK